MDALIDMSMNYDQSTSTVLPAHCDIPATNLVHATIAAGTKAAPSTPVLPIYIRRRCDVIASKPIAPCPPLPSTHPEAGRSLPTPVPLLKHNPVSITTDVPAATAPPSRLDTTSSKRRRNDTSRATRREVPSPIPPVSRSVLRAARERILPHHLFDGMWFVNPTFQSDGGISLAAPMLPMVLSTDTTTCVLDHVLSRVRHIATDVTVRGNIMYCGETAIGVYVKTSCLGDDSITTSIIKWRRHAQFAWVGGLAPSHRQDSLHLITLGGGTGSTTQPSCPSGVPIQVSELFQLAYGTPFPVDSATSPMEQVLCHVARDTWMEEHLRSAPATYSMTVPLSWLASIQSDMLFGGSVVYTPVADAPVEGDHMLTEHGGHIVRAVFTSGMWSWYDPVGEVVVTSATISPLPPARALSCDHMRMVFKPHMNVALDAMSSRDDLGATPFVPIDGHRPTSKAFYQRVTRYLKKNGFLSHVDLAAMKASAIITVGLRATLAGNGAGGAGADSAAVLKAQRSISNMCMMISSLPRCEAQRLHDSMSDMTECSLGVLGSFGAVGRHDSTTRVRKLAPELAIWNACTAIILSVCPETSMYSVSITSYDGQHTAVRTLSKDVFMSLFAPRHETPAPARWESYFALRTFLSGRRRIAPSIVSPHLAWAVRLDAIEAYQVAQSAVAGTVSQTATVTSAYLEFADAATLGDISKRVAAARTLVHRQATATLTTQAVACVPSKYATLTYFTSAHENGIRNMGLTKPGKCRTTDSSDRPARSKTTRPILALRDAKTSSDFLDLMKVVCASCDNLIYSHSTTDVQNRFAQSAADLHLTLMALAIHAFPGMHKVMRRWVARMTIMADWFHYGHAAYSLVDVSSRPAIYRGQGSRRNSAATDSNRVIFRSHADVGMKRRVATLFRRHVVMTLRTSRRPPANGKAAVDKAIHLPVDPSARPLTPVDKIICENDWAHGMFDPSLPAPDSLPERLHAVAATPRDDSIISGAIDCAQVITTSVCQCMSKSPEGRSMAMLLRCGVMGVSPERRVRRAGIQSAFDFFWKPYLPFAKLRTKSSAVDLARFAKAIPVVLCYSMWSTFAVHYNHIEDTNICTKRGRRGESVKEVVPPTRFIQGRKPHPSLTPLPYRHSAPRTIIRSGINPRNRKKARGHL